MTKQPHAARNDLPAAPANSPESLLRLRAVLGRIGVGRTRLYEMVRQKAFPAPLEIPALGRVKVWAESDVSKWIEERTAESRKGA